MFSCIINTTYVLTVLVCLVSMEMISANSGVCYTKVIERAGYNQPYTTSSSYSYSTSCWSWSGRCSKTGTRYHQHYYYVHPIYKQTSHCCSGYEGPNCIPICSPVCVSGNGECKAPYKCTCFSGWTGETCRYDSNLLNWCSSISDNDIDNSPLQSVRSSLDVYCESKSSSIAYQPSQTAYVAPRLMNDSILALDQYKYYLYQFWKQHPYIRNPCCYSNEKYHLTLVQNLIKFDSEFYNLIGGLKESVAIELRKELETVCSTNSSSDVFCPIKAALHVIDAAAKLPPSKADWTLDTTKYTQAISVSIYILQKHNSDYSNISLPFTEHDLLVDCTNIILKYMQDKETEKLKAFAEYLPPASVYDAPLLCQTDSLCIFMKMVEQIHNYISEIDLDENVITSDGKKRLILNTNTDYREFLRQKQLDRILTVLSEQGATSLEIANNLKKHMTTKFSEIRGYFEKVETFNQRIAEADINYVNDRIEGYQNDLKNVVDKLKREMATILITATDAVGLKIVEKQILLALSLAAAINPLGTIFGGGTLQAAVAAANELQAAFAESIKLQSVRVALVGLKDKTGTISMKLKKNDQFLGNVNNLIKVSATVNEKQFDKFKNNFVTKYIEYNPQVKLPEIIEIGSHWQALIAAVCDVIDDVDTVVDSLLARKLDDSRKYCQFAPTLADNMIALYEEIYGFQFDLIDSMAAYMRASISLNAAKEINNEFEEVTKLNVNSGTTLTVLQMIGGLSYVTYHTHLLQTVNLYCNVLEYMKGGKKQTECKGAKTDVALLIANVEPVCISETYKYYNIPTWNSTNDDTAYIDIAQLFSGLKVIFKIPNVQWLLDHNWIHENEKDFALYVKKFDVFLPVKPVKPKEFYVISDPVLHNVVVPGSNSTEYIIVPHTHLIHEYSMGPRRTPCSQPKVQNPYTSCNQENISELCHYSSTAKSHLYPSIYSQWSLSVVGGEGFTIPKPATDMSIVVGIQICKIEQADYNQLAQSQDTSECCKEGQYRPNISSSCTPCPRGSKSSLDGYYCEKEDDAMFMNT